MPRIEGAPRQDISSPAESETREKCGIVGIRTKQPAKHFDTLLSSAYGVQHRGQQGAGLSMAIDNSFEVFTGDGFIIEIFDKPTISRFNQTETKASMFHSRYGTDGDYNSDNLQPIQIRTSDGAEISLIHNGQLLNVEELRAKVKADLPEGASDTLVAAHILAEAEGETNDDKFLNFVDSIDGAFNIIACIGDTMYVGRDSHSLHPLVLGHVSIVDKESSEKVKGHIIASETHAFGKDVKMIRTVKSGEVIKIDDAGLTRLRNGESRKLDPACIFEDAYFSHPNSKFPVFGTEGDGSREDEWFSVANFRIEIGRELARKKRIENASFVLAIPDSGVHVAAGYAAECGTAIMPYITREHYVGRAFQADNELEKIPDKILKKLNFVEGTHWRDAIVLNGDDSGIRGNVSRIVTQKERELGAREVHWIFGLPMVVEPCDLGISMRTNNELIAHTYGKDEDAIAKAIGADSVTFILPQDYMRILANMGKSESPEQSLPNFIIPEDPLDIFRDNGACGKCITGRYPYEIEKYLANSGRLLNSGELFNIEKRRKTATTLA